MSTFGIDDDNAVIKMLKRILNMTDSNVIMRYRKLVQYYTTSNQFEWFFKLRDNACINTIKNKIQMKLHQ